MRASSTRSTHESVLTLLSLSCDQLPEADSRAWVGWGLSTQGGDIFASIDSNNSWIDSWSTIRPPKRTFSGQIVVHSAFWDMRAGSFRKIIATHNPVRLFPEELKRTFKYCDMPSRFRSRKPRLSRLSGLKINVCAYTLWLELLELVWVGPPLLIYELELGSS